jgi:hypothetical protein
MRPSVHNRRSLGKPFFLILNFDEPRLIYTDGVYPYKSNGVGARSAQGVAKTCRKKIHPCASNDL